MKNNIRFFIKLYLYHLAARIPWLGKQIFPVRAFDRATVNFANLLISRYQSVASDISYRQKMYHREHKIFSQNGEDGLLLYIFSQVGVTNKTLIEFGIETGHECNSANLIINFGWNGLLMDGRTQNVKKASAYYHEINGFDSDSINIKQSFVTADNINSVIKSSGIENEIDLLSIDVDGNDYWIWRAIEVVNPRVVIIEYNASFGWDRSITIKYESTFTRFAKHKSGWYHGSSLTALAKLGQAKGYKLICADSFGCNAFFLRNDIEAGELQEMSPRDAFYPQPKRCQIVSQEEQFAYINHLEYIEV